MDFYHIAILLLLAADLAVDLVLRRLSASRRSLPLPPAVADIYDAGDYARWLDYSAEKRKLGAAEKIFDTLVLALLFGTNVLHMVHAALPGGEWGKSLLLLTLFSALLTVLTVPFDWAREMRIEEKYGFNRATKKTFVRDQIVGFVLNTALNLLLYVFVAWVWGRFGARAIWLVYAGLAAVVLVFSLLSTTFMRLYNKFTVLEDGELRDRLSAMFREAGYQLENIYVMDASRRTAKVNAFCTGLGRLKKIVLYDNLVENYTPGEIAAVFAHELGHYRRRDTLKNTLYTLIVMGVVTAIIAGFAAVPALSESYGFAGVSVVFGVILLQSVVLGPVLRVAVIPQVAVARKMEFLADAEAVRQGSGEDLISALKKLSRDNFSDLNPHPVVVFLEHNHPTTADRIEAIRRQEAGHAL